MEVSKQLDEKSRTFIRSMEQLEEQINSKVYDFLINPQRNVLLIITVMTGEANLLVYQTMRKFSAVKLKKKHKTLMKHYLGPDNCTFVDWPQLIQTLGDEMLLPEFRNLVVCEVPAAIELDDYRDVLDQLVQIMRANPEKKMILITPMHNILRRFASMAFGLDS
ncbi:hypothetical protein D910_05394 [Dendroctonus ponderosae]|uniref:Uncharacterized protein n=1 Tax=Dendroctonus ponderosae TaxID=77166 RepID=U4UDK5_DENPD|nr:hypothetical protein D910_05394 [Dendroctonus ponderosae]